jgi:anthranilate synthase
MALRRCAPAPRCSTIPNPAEEEEAETELKASAMMAAIREASGRQFVCGRVQRDAQRSGAGVSILLVDHEDSFVHTLANYFRQTGATVSTVRTPVAEEVFDRINPDLVVLSPGPGTPEGFRHASDDQEGAQARNLPIFGVCLGLQALAEAYGGELRQLAIPMHGKPSRIRVQQAGYDLLRPRPKEVTVGRYHSIFADPVRLPRRFHHHGGERGRRRSWHSSTGANRSRRCSSTRNRS